MPDRPRTLVMTGATSGIGAYALRRLMARPGTRAIIGARSSSTRPALDGVQVLPLDLSSLSAVREFTAAVLARLDGEPIDMLVLNAGAQFLNTSARSADGYELTFAVNHLAHYLLARLLLPAVAHGGRIVLTTSDTHDPAIFRSAPKPPARSCGRKAPASPASPPAERHAHRHHLHCANGSHYPQTLPGAATGQCVNPLPTACEPAAHSTTTKQTPTR